jgi:hypothetical protein
MVLSYTAARESGAVRVPAKFPRPHILAQRILLPLAVLLFATSAWSQGAAASQAAKDPRAASILNSYISASGGPAAAVQDFVATGTITYFGGGTQTQAPATAKCLGAAGFRLDAQLPTGTRSWVVDRFGGKLTNPDGSTSRVPWGNAAGLMSATWPLPGVLAALKDPDTQITYAGQVTFNGRAAYEIRIQQVISASAAATDDLGGATARSLFIDTTTYLALGLENQVFAVGSSRRAYLRRVLFSDYRSANGINFPFSVTESVAGQKTWSYQVASVSFNTGLTTAAFVY